MRLKPERWHRVVITVRCKNPPDKKKKKKTGNFDAFRGDDDSRFGGKTKNKKQQQAGGEFRTYIDTKPCCTISGDATAAQWFKKNGRFSLDAKSMYLFSSNDAMMMPGKVAIRCVLNLSCSFFLFFFSFFLILSTHFSSSLPLFLSSSLPLFLFRYVRVDAQYAKPEDVKSMRARDKILSMYNENLKDEIDKQRKGLVLSELFAKPRPMWMDPSLIGLFGDAFIEGTRFEGASMLPFAFMSMGLAISRMLETPTLSTTKGSTNGGGSLDILYGLDADDRAKVANVVHVMEASQNIFMMVQRLLKYSNTGQLMWFLRKFRTILRSLGAGQAILVPALVARSEMLIFVMRKPGMHESFFLLFFFYFYFLVFS